MLVSFFQSDGILQRLMISKKHTLKGEQLNQPVEIMPWNQRIPGSLKGSPTRKRSMRPGVVWRLFHYTFNAIWFNTYWFHLISTGFYLLRILNHGFHFWFPSKSKEWLEYLFDIPCLIVFRPPNTHQISHASQNPNDHYYFQAFTSHTAYMPIISHCSNDSIPIFKHDASGWKPDSMSMVFLMMHVLTMLTIWGGAGGGGCINVYVDVKCWHRCMFIRLGN